MKIIEWQRVVQRVTTNDNDWQRMTTNSTTSDNEWSFWLIFLFLREEPALCTLKILFKHWQRSWRLLTIEVLFQDSFIFGEATSSLFFNYFDTTVTLLKQLFLQSSCFFRSSIFKRLIFLQQLFFSEYLFFGTKPLLSSHFLRIGSYLAQLLFGTATFLAEELLRIKMSREEVLCRSRYLCTASAFSEKLHLFQKMLFIGVASFHSYTFYLSFRN